MMMKIIVVRALDDGIADDDAFLWGHDATHKLKTRHVRKDDEKWLKGIRSRTHIAFFFFPLFLLSFS